MCINISTNLCSAHMLTTLHVYSIVLHDEASQNSTENITVYHNQHRTWVRRGWPARLALNCWSHLIVLFSGVRRSFLIGGYENIACEAYGKFLELHLKQHPFCANLAVKWMLVYNISKQSQVNLISAYNKAIGLDGLRPLCWKYGGRGGGGGGAPPPPPPQLPCFLRQW